MSTESGSSDPRRFGRGLQTRAAIMIAVCATTAPMAAAGLWGESLGLPTAISVLLAAVGLIGGAWAILWGSEPFRRQELRENVGKPAPAFTPRLVLALLGPMLLVPVVWHYTVGMPWRAGWSLAAAFVLYFAIFIPLGRLQKRGISPYFRPAWYGFPAAGVIAGLAWSALAPGAAVEGVGNGIIWSLMHYAYVRWAMRGARSIDSARAASPPSASPHRTP
ncbi:hypothetical protein [Longimicrobium sp.]|jgi:hypothetical protein|uniref:hypothetical protein n=1 Tax=Longimicrobium sp. TaxID=2029185 RepID=UPI002ED94392